MKTIFELCYELQKYTSQLLTFFVAVPAAFPADLSSPRLPGNMVLFHCISQWISDTNTATYLFLLQYWLNQHWGLFPLLFRCTGPSLESIGAKKFWLVSGPFFEVRSKISLFDGYSMVAMGRHGGGTSNPTRRLMPLGVGKRLQEYGVIWIAPNTHLWVMGELDV